MTTIAIVGGGAAGAMTAIHLARVNGGHGDLQVVVYDGSPRPARGVAYSTADDRHLLNVPADRMSAIDDDPAHFLSWLRARHRGCPADDFRPRREYGDYLADTLAAHGADIRLTVRRTRVTAVSRATAGFRIAHESGIDDVDACVLAMGHAPPQIPAAVASPAAAGFVADPWQPDGLAQIERVTRPGDCVLTIGCGLTAVDVALSLASNDRRVVAVSRNGLLPRAHRNPMEAPVPFEPPTDGGSLTAQLLADLVTAHVTKAQRSGRDWRAAVDGVRPVTADLWRRLPLDERRRFLAHHERRWDVHRHRMAPQVAATLDALTTRRLFTAVRADLVEVVGTERHWRVRLRRDDTDETLAVAAVVNCTGPSCDIERYPDLGPGLVDQGLVQPDPLGLGIRTTAAGAVIDANGRSDPRFLAVGVLRRGSLYESTAIPELRAQAAVAARLLTSVAAEPMAEALPPPYPAEQEPAGAPAAGRRISRSRSR